MFWWGMDYIFFEKFKVGNLGLKVAIKDSIDIQGFKTVAGSRALLNTEPAFKNAKVVDLVLQNNCQIIGKTNLHELAFGITGINHFTGTSINPKYPDLIPGGSSSGSAAAVASGQVDFSIGTDTGGSIRMPAACCGVYGLKPTFARVSREGAWPQQTSLDCVGPFAANIDMLIQAMSIICPDFKMDQLAVDTPPKLAWLTVNAEAQVLDTLQAYLSERGYADLPHVQLSHFDAAYGAGMQVINFETWQAFGALTQTGLVGADVNTRLLNAAKTSEAQVAEANQIREQLQQELDALLDQFDAILLPTLPQIPPKVADAGNTAAFLNMTALVRPFNLSGHPALTIPLETVDGQPVGLQIISKHHHDEQLCAIGKYIVNAQLPVKEESLS